MPRRLRLQAANKRRRTWRPREPRCPSDRPAIPSAELRCLCPKLRRLRRLRPKRPWSSRLCWKRRCSGPRRPSLRPFLSLFLHPFLHLFLHLFLRPSALGRSGRPPSVPRLAHRPAARGMRRSPFHSPGPAPACLMPPRRQPPPARTLYPAPARASHRRHGPPRAPACRERPRPRCRTGLPPCKPTERHPSHRWRKACPAWRPPFHARIARPSPFPQRVMTTVCPFSSRQRWRRVQPRRTLPHWSASFRHGSPPDSRPGSRPGSHMEHRPRHNPMRSRLPRMPLPCPPHTLKHKARPHPCRRRSLHRTLVPPHLAPKPPHRPRRHPWPRPPRPWCREWPRPYAPCPRRPPRSRHPRPTQRLRSR